MDSQTKAKIDSLLYELQQWGDEPQVSVGELARRFQLDPLIVKRIVQAQGWDLDEAVPEEVTDEVTHPISLDDEK